ncbi:hypothetical protein L1987_05783 [Smallanthus sonchifolius]|uniref:Uncharacterized protein n=1 Tax=Smallanthus sonchifolius TaxID=185202 RepID=A0ACB9JWB3_9ASTR|nr:hypothetical protein L1987_05783 [Smallanthus sonchifolius]
MELKNMVALVARSGRQLQRYNKGNRQVVECIPYRIKGNKGKNLEDALEVLGILGKWHFKSKGNKKSYEGYMFPLLVKEQLDLWPEKNIRQRVWVSVPKAKEVCQQSWMKEALDLLVKRLEVHASFTCERATRVMALKEHLPKSLGVYARS